MKALRETLRPVMGYADILGRFHADFVGEGDEKWADAVDGEKSKSGLFVIRADQFGQKGSVVRQLAADAEADKIKAALLAANAEFAKTEKRKVYSDHVAQGRRERVYFENGMPYGEDRDGDGKIDHPRGQRHGPGGERPPEGRRPGRGGPPPEGRRPPRRDTRP